MPSHKRRAQPRPQSNQRRRGTATTEAGHNAYFSTVSAGLRALAPASNVQPALHAVCRDLGRWSYLACLALNGVLQDDTVLTHLRTASMVAGRGTGQGLVTVVSKVWRATEEVAIGRGFHQYECDAVILKQVEKVLRRKPRTVKKALAPVMDHRLKEPLLVDMATELKKLLKLFPTRLLVMLRVLLFHEIGGSVSNEVVGKVAVQVLDEVLAPTYDANKDNDDDNPANRSDPFGSLAFDVASAARKLVSAQRLQMGDLVKDSFSQRRDSTGDADGELRASIGFVRSFDDAGLVALFPRLRDISRWAEEYRSSSSPSPPAELEPAHAEAALVEEASMGEVATFEPDAVVADVAVLEPVAADVHAEAALSPGDVATFEPLDTDVAVWEPVAPEVALWEPVAAEAALVDDTATVADPSRRLGVLSAQRSTVATGGDRFAIISEPPVEAGVVSNAPVSTPAVFEAAVLPADGAAHFVDADEQADELVVAPVDERLPTLPRKWRPKSFALSPMHQLQAASVRFSASTESAFFKMWTADRLLDDKGKKVPLPTDADRDRFKKAFEGKVVGAPLIETGSVFGSRADEAQWKLASYTTTGVQVGATFAAKRESCRTADLNLEEVGAEVALEGDRSRSKFLQTRATIPASPHHHRGCLTIAQGAADGQLGPQDTPVVMIGVDPGGGTTEKTAAFATCRSDEKALGATFGYVSLAAHRKRSGTKRAQEAEESRRRVNREYAEAIQELRSCGGSSKSASASYQLYVDAALATFERRARELTSMPRSVVRWQRARCKMSAAARAADELCGQISPRPERVAMREVYDYPCGRPRLDKAARDALADKLRRRIAALKAARAAQPKPKPKLPVVVFYGAGTFPSAFPHNRVRRHVALRGLLCQTNEAYTSVNCPGTWGAYLEDSGWILPDRITCCKLIDVADVAPVGSAPAAATDPLYPRLRTCNRDGSGRCVGLERMQFLPREHRHGRVCYDRDHLAALNILLVGRCALFGLKRPKAFCYPVREEAA